MFVELVNHIEEHLGLEVDVPAVEARLLADARRVITRPLNDLTPAMKLVSGHPGDGVARVWTLPLRCQALIDQSRTAVPRGLGKVERAVAFLTDDRSGWLTTAYAVARPWFGWIVSGDDASCR